MTQPQRYTKTSEDSYFKDLDAVVSDQWLIIGDQDYDLTIVSASEVISEPGKHDWQHFTRDHLSSLVGYAGIWAVATVFQLPAGFLLGIGIIRTVWEAFKELTDPKQYALLLNTNSGPIRLLTRKSDATFNLVAREINKRISHLQLAGPLLPAPPSPAQPLLAQQQSGEPTRRI